ncbi:MAG: hypothetical protein CMJ64_09135 [Planctomycetaceae bacterium]|nr:hypothetical protein [Planctomycetaceae bacterium]
MKRLHPLVLLTLSICFAATAYGADKDGFTSLFDGKTLDGWEGNLDIFHVVDGAIVAGTLKEPIPHNEFLCTKKEYGDFELRLKAKLVGEGKNAGIQFRSKRIPDHHEVSGYQCDMGGQPTQNIWGALYDESRRRKFLAVGEQEGVKKAFKADDWNEFVIRCQGNRIQIWLNGFRTVNYTEKEDVARTGIIGLQIHGGKPAEASYKDIRIRVLKSS